MSKQTNNKFPVFVMCGSDPKRRKLLKVLDPEKKYKSKALLPFLGKRVIDWQLEALKESPYIEGLYLIGLAEEDITFDYPVHYVPSDTQAEFTKKLIDGINYLEAIGKKPGMIVISTCDAPAIEPESINKFFDQLNKYQDYDFVMSLVPEYTIKDIFPQSGRVVGRFKDHQVFPGELYALSPQAIKIGQEVIHELNTRRREFDRERRKITLGPVIRYLARKPSTWDTILKYLLKKATLADVENAFSRAFNCRAKGIIIHHPGFGMDMDLPDDYEKLKAFVKQVKEVKV